MKGQLLKNIPAKLLALIAACVLWLHVATEQTYEYTFKYPLVLEGLPSEYVLGAPLPDSVEVILRGKGKDLITLLFAEGAVVIDGRGFKYSEKFFNLRDAELRIPEKDCKVVGFSRQEPLRLMIDRYASQEVPIKSNFVLEPAEGFVANNDKVRFEPAKVVIGGPESQIRKIENVFTEPETLRDLNTTTTVVVSIEDPGPLLSCTPQQVSATIVVEQLHQKAFHGIRVQIKGGKPRRGEKLIPESIDLVFTGAKENIESLSERDINVFVDYVDVRTQGNQLWPVVVHPPGVSVASMKPEYFTFESE